MTLHLGVAPDQIARVHEVAAELSAGEAEIVCGQAAYIDV